MKKNIIIVLLVLATVFMGVMAEIKSQEAEKVMMMAEKNLELAQESEMKAREQEQKAVEAAAAALIAIRKAEEIEAQLEACNK